MPGGMGAIPTDPDFLDCAQYLITLRRQSRRRLTAFHHLDDDEAALAQRIEIQAAGLQLLRRFVHQHQGGQFVRTQHDTPY
ncbi:hypothetical protein PSP6_270211 [Paraburkholderia tropica]|nr:hypothetical protein PSP6_270211 [Paraburkholderia tropica]